MIIDKMIQEQQKNTNNPELPYFHTIFCRLHPVDRTILICNFLAVKITINMNYNKKYKINYLTAISFENSFGTVQ